MPTTSPFVLDDVSLTLSPVSGSGEEYQCQLNRAELVPSTGGGGGGATFESFCNTYSGGGGTASWTLELTGMQAYADAADLSMLLFNEEGEAVRVRAHPDGRHHQRHESRLRGTVTLVPTNIGGTANQYATLTVSLPCAGKPTLLSTPPA